MTTGVRVTIMKATRRNAMLKARVKLLISELNEMKKPLKDSTWTQAALMVSLRMKMLTLQEGNLEAKEPQSSKTRMNSILTNLLS